MSGRCLQVKAVLLKEGVEDGLKEIRRFRVDEEETGGLGGRQLLQTLLTRVQSVFNVDPSSQKCTLFWKDEDGDLIQFSSEEELRHAVDNMSDGILRVYVTVTGRAGEGSATRGPERNAHHGDYVPPRASFYIPPPPPPPPPPHHPHGPPPPFCGPWTQFGWKKWKPMGPGGWKGGWKGGMFYGCPWAMGHEGYGCGRKGRGFFKHCWDKKMKKMMKTMRWNMAATGQQNEFNEVRKQVPAKFRTWVRQYVHAWYTQGPEAAQNANTDKLPEGVGHDFPQWLPSFLSRHFSHPKSSQEWDEEMRDTGKDGQMGNAPDCLPPVYFRWLCLFLPRFFARNGHVNTSDCEEDESFSYPGGHCHAFRQGFYARRGFGWPGKHGSCKKNKGGKHKRCNSSSESDDSDGGHQAWRKVPKGLRKFVRMSFKQLRKGKGDKTKIREKASRAGVSKEVQEFVEQVMLEWNGKLSRQPHHVVAKEMMKGERTLPSGMQREHFQWMVRFMARWDAGKCRFMPGWLGADSATDESSGEEATPKGQDCGACPPYTRTMGSVPGPPFMGMPGAPPHGFGMYPGMDHPFTPPPPPPPMYGCFPPPPPPPTGFPPAYMFECPEQDTKNDKPDDGKGYTVYISDSETSSSSTDDMDHVTEGVKKM